MKSFRNVVISRNLLIGAGANYLAGWLTLPLALAFGKLTQGIVYVGNFEVAVIGPLVAHIPKALAAAAAGVVTVWFVESARPVRWVIFPVLLYAVFGFLGYHWARPPVFLDRVGQAVGALFPAVTCALGGIAAGWRKGNAD